MCRLCASQGPGPGGPASPFTRRAFSAGAVAAIAAFARPAASADGLLQPSLRLLGSKPGQRRVALTLDACPGGYDSRIATFLAENGVPATIFLTAAWIHRNPEGLAFLLSHRDLFAFENHGARHLPAVLGTGTIYGLRVAGDLETVRREVEDGASAVRDATGTMPRWYRDAAALYSPAAIGAIEAMGFAIAGYSLNSDMGASLPAASVAARIAGARDGEVIIGHLTQPKRPSGLGIVAGVRELLRQGAVFAHLDPPAPQPVAAPAPPIYKHEG